MRSPLLAVRGLHKRYPGGITAVDSVSFEIWPGKCVGLVGESGSGKSTLARLLLGLEHSDGGEVHLLGHPLHQLRGEALRQVRRHMQVVFQDPAASLNPRLPIWKSVTEPLGNFPQVTPAFLQGVHHSPRDAAARLLDLVGLNSDLLTRYPHELSGGQKQRVAIARGLSLQPDLLICDEPTASLDVSVQAQILNLLREMQEQLGVAYLFISHDIASVRFLSDEVLVMKGGRLVDRFTSATMWDGERHPYTRALLAAVTA